MVLGVVSDTHGNTALMLETAALMAAMHGAEVFFHLGDNYEDGEALTRAGYTVNKVPGLCCPAYRGGRVAKCLFVSFDGVTVACAHAEKDLRHRERAAAIVLTGHTHCAQVQLFGRALYVNPGHLAARINRGQPASYAIVDVTPETVRAAIHEVSGRLRHELTVKTALLG